MFRIAVLFLFCGCVFAKYEIYDGHALYKVNIESEIHAEVLNNLESKHNLDFWQRAAPGYDAVVLVPKQYRFLLDIALLFNGIKFKVEVDNVKPFLDEENHLLTEASRRNSGIGRNGALTFNKIHSYEEVDLFLEILARLYPNLVTVVNAGRSFQRRNIKYIKISTTDFKDHRKPVIFVQSLLHARDWVTLPASLYTIHKLIIDITERDLVEKIDWIILPIANPDGYVASRRNERFWHKNRATSYSFLTICRGVDLNRNFGFDWGNTSSNFACSEVFHGRRAFSEPETRIIKTILDQYVRRMEMFIDIHSFGSMILYGYGTGELPANALTLQVAGVNMAQAIDSVKRPYNKDYTVGNFALVLNKASGTCSDYAQAIGVPLAYTFKLPGFRFGFDTALGFLVHPDFIEQAGIETWEGIKSGAQFVLRVVGQA
ncbi:carboxypeptidase B-like [Leptidea sinapis]|uniref:carboxypeptidase B-like n=1 Tax=Leptidea sinapis TaxID=189913 RepID=UPI0021339161|nr:carboxypeptidase B-like [Leptidea sinapis]